jgi:hypothetical protein
MEIVLSLVACAALVSLSRQVPAHPSAIGTGADLSRQDAAAVAA